MAASEEKFMFLISSMIEQLPEEKREEINYILKSEIYVDQLLDNGSLIIEFKEALKKLWHTQKDDISANRKKSVHGIFRPSININGTIAFPIVSTYEKSEILDPSLDCRQTISRALVVGNAETGKIEVDQESGLIKKLTGNNPYDIFHEFKFSDTVDRSVLSSVYVKPPKESIKNKLKLCS